MIVLATVTWLLGISARIAIGRAASASGRVDHYYWMLMADAYRAQRGLPVRLRGKYLLEDEEQAYPPLFGLLLGRWRLDRGGLAAVWLLELLQMAVLAALMASVYAPWPAVALGLGMYATAPVLIIYNTQLNSRILGDVFLFTLLAAEASAVVAAGSPAGQAALWFVAALMTAFVIMSHKMTLQLQVVLLFPWSWALGTVTPVVAFAAGAALYLALVGPRFAAYQFRAHWDIVKFWNQHWPFLGAHQFNDSPIYGSSADRASGFHRRGVRGVLQHLKTVASYAPAHALLPFASLVAGSWPPAWLLVWLGAIYIWALATLFVPRLKCLGAGHLYVFNAVGPGACYVAWLPDNTATVTVLSVGALLTAAALVAAWRVIRARPTARDDMFHRAVAVLAAVPATRVAVFPLQSAEAVAWATPHAILWGGHGYGFSRLEGFFPVLTVPLGDYLRKYDIRWLLWDAHYCPLSTERLRLEGIAVAAEESFGRWRLVSVAIAHDASMSAPSET